MKLIKLLPGDTRIVIEHNGIEYKFVGRGEGLQVYIDGQLEVLPISSNTVILNTNRAATGVLMPLRWKE